MTTPLEREFQREFPGDPASPAHARGFAAGAVSDLMDGSPPRDLCEDTELVVSELVTNAVRAGGETVTVTISRLTGPVDRLAVRVRDTAPGWPEPKIAGVHDTGGRGLAMVSALSSAWGVRLDSDGKTVWAELDVPGRAHTAAAHS